MCLRRLVWSCVLAHVIKTNILFAGSLFCREKGVTNWDHTVCLVILKWINSLSHILFCYSFSCFFYFSMSGQVKHSPLTYISLVSFLSDIGKQYKPRSDAAWSGSPLLACRMLYHTLNKNEKHLPTFHLYSECDRAFCKQTAETLIRRRLIWVCTETQSRFFLLYVVLFVVCVFR